MTDETRELTRDAAHWRVHEADASRSPGARGDRCLIFDGDGVVRRAWIYPDNWAELADDALWALLEAALPRAMEGPPSIAHLADVTSQPDVAASVEACVRARSLLSEISLIREASRALRDERARLVEECRRVRNGMRRSIEAYAQALRDNGVPPERALVLIKTAVQDGLGAANARDEPVATELVKDGVSWGIAGYYGTR